MTWIPISERLPDCKNDAMYGHISEGLIIYSKKHGVVDDVVACKINEKLYFLTHYFGYDYDQKEIKLSDITHWMPLPEPPSSSIASTTDWDIEIPDMSNYNHVLYDLTVNIDEKNKKVEIKLEHY